MGFWQQFKHLVSYVPGTVRLYQYLFARFEPAKVPRQPLVRGQMPRLDIEALKLSYLQSPAASEADTFVLYRIIGNDLVPRHRKGQSRANLQFVLDHEPDLVGCEKRFVLNRLVDPDEEETIASMLEDRGFPYLHLPFSLEEYRKIPWDILGVPPEYAPYAGRFARLSQAEQERILMRLYRHKNNSVMHNNQARNAALAEGRQVAKWVLPFDGNCFLSAKAWHQIREAVTSRPYFAYYIVPMARVIDNNFLLDPDFEPKALEEPQILFRRDSELIFNEHMYYGRRPKVELLWRLGVPGDWDHWLLEPWDLPGPVYADQAGCFACAGSVARLNSGQADLEIDPVQGKVDRGLARNKAIAGLLDFLDHKAAPGQDLDHPLIIYKPPIPPELYSAAQKQLESKLLQAAEEALQRGPYSVIHKSTLPPSGDIHDYWHPAPYYWPNPLTPSGRPYVSRDGQRVPGTRLYEPESDQYDRTRLQRLFDDTFILALAWDTWQDLRFARHAARLVQTWFLEPATAMNPSLEYAQVRLGHNNDRGSNSGIIEMKDLYYFLDAVRLLSRAGALSENELTAIKKWFESYLQWLQNSPQGRKERAAANNHGVYYDLQVASIAAFLQDRLLVRDTLRDSRFRILEHFDAQGRQPEEMKRTMTAHYCCFNLQGWIHLAQLAESCGEDLWNFKDEDGRGIQAGMYWLLGHIGRDWPYEQIQDFDYQRFYPIYYACRTKYGLPSELEEKIAHVPEPADIKPIFYPHDGIQPFWQLVSKE